MSRPEEIAQKGGKIIGEGEYGYAVYPALKCKDKADVKRKNKLVNADASTTAFASTALKVGKLTDVDDAKLEYRISRELKTIPGSDNYFILIDDLCEPAPRTQQTNKDVLTHTDLKGKQLPLFAQLIMPFGGKPLSSVPTDTRHIDFMPLAQQLLEAGTLLLMKGIVHNDIHRANVLLESRWKAKLIDFGVSWKPRELNKDHIPPIETYFNARITSEAPEVSVISGITNNMTVDDAIERVIADKIALKTYQILTNKSNDRLRAIFERFIQTSWCFNNQEWLIFFQLYWSKIDAWAIGVIIMFLYSQLVMDSEFTNSESYLKNKSMIIDVIDSMCTPDAGERYDCARALSKWAPSSPILQRIDVQQWLEKERIIREKLDSK